jgi:DNA polymerase III subunit epsilon
MAREIILDVETTGIDPRQGHRVIEIACIELEDFIPTGKHFHQLIHPERDIDPEAERVHGISLASLEGKPRFHHPEVADAFLEFVGDAILIAHNAGFDRGFVNHELTKCGKIELPEPRWIDTLAMARVKFPGMYNSLDALCKRFKISLAEREKHGALIDCKLLAQVYLELCGGRERALDLSSAEAKTAVSLAASAVAYGARPRPLAPRSTTEERAAHEAFVAKTLKDKAVWLKGAAQ